MELITNLLKRKNFFNQIKILYPLWGVQPISRKSQIIYIHLIEKIKVNFTHSFLGAMG